MMSTPMNICGVRTYESSGAHKMPDEVARDLREACARLARARLVTPIKNQIYMHIQIDIYNTSSCEIQWVLLEIDGMH